MEFARWLQTQITRDRKLSKPRSVYVTPDSSPTRPKPSDDEKGRRSVLSYSKSSERSVRSHSLSDSNPQTDSGDNSDASRHTMTSNQDRRCLKARRWERHKGGHEGWDKSNRGKLSLPIFRDSSKDDTISYDDWRCEVDALILRGHSQKKVKLAVLDALEGRPKRTAQVADTDHKGWIGKGKLPKILEVLENSYGRSVTYQSLVGELCSIRQKRGETPKAYYKHLTTIILLLRECHGDRIKVKELDSTAKDCFYSGLHEQYQPLVIHLKDKSYTTASDLLKAIRVHEETESNLRDHGYYYRPKYNTSGKPTIDKYAKKSEGFAAKVTQLPSDEPPSHSETSDASDVDENFEVGYYQGVIQAADMNDDVGRCYNCNDPGHKWRECTKPLHEGLKWAYKRLQQQQLNYKGDVKKKGVHIPQSRATVPAPVAARAWDPPLILPQLLERRSPRTMVGTRKSWLCGIRRPAYPCPSQQRRKDEHGYTGLCMPALPRYGSYDRTRFNNERNSHPRSGRYQDWTYGICGHEGRDRGCTQLRRRSSILGNRRWLCLQLTSASDTWDSHDQLSRHGYEGDGNA